MLREFFAVAARAALEWALASLLLANGAAFCLIAAAAARLRLGSPCILCARVHRLLCSSSASAGDVRLLLCDAHLAAVAAETRADTDRRDGAARTRGLTEVDDPDQVSGLETQRDVSIGSEICEQDLDGVQPLAADGRSDTPRTTSSSEDGGSGGALVSLFELSPIIAPPRAGGDSSVDPGTAPELVAVEGDELLTVGQIASLLREQRRELEALRAELAGERRARAEAEEHRRQLEEQGELDREATRLAMQLVHESETEKHGLQRQLEAFTVRAQLYELDGDDGNGGGGEANGDGNVNGEGNNYQSLVDFLPGSVYSSSPDLANLLKLYTESAGNGGGRRRQRDEYGEPAIAAVVEEEEVEEEEVAVSVTVTAATESGGSVDETITTVVTESLHERSTDSCYTETVVEAA